METIKPILVQQEENADKASPPPTKKSRFEILKQARAVKAAKAKARKLKRNAPHSDSKDVIKRSRTEEDKKVDSADEIVHKHSTVTVTEPKEEAQPAQIAAPAIDVGKIMNNLQATVERIEKAQHDNSALESILTRLRELESNVVDKRAKLEQSLQRPQSPPVPRYKKKRSSDDWGTTLF